MEQNNLKCFSRRNCTCCLSKVLHNSFHPNTVVHLAPYNISTREDRSVWYDSRSSSSETNNHFIYDKSIQLKCEKVFLSHQDVCGSKSNNLVENLETTLMDFFFLLNNIILIWVTFKRIIQSYYLFIQYFNTELCL